MKTKGCWFLLEKSDRRIDDEVRIIVDSNVDYILKNIEETLERCKYALISQGIEPTLETSLSFLTGTFLGMIEYHYVKKFDRFLETNEFFEFFELLNKRATEIRIAFLKAQFQKKDN